MSPHCHQNAGFQSTREFLSPLPSSHWKQLERAGAIGQMAPETCRGAVPFPEPQHQGAPARSSGRHVTILLQDSPCIHPEIDFPVLQAPRWHSLPPPALGAPTYPVAEPGQAAVEPGEQGAALLEHTLGHLTTRFPEQLQLRPQDGHGHGTVVGQAVLQPPARESSGEGSAGPRDQWH